HPAHRAIRNTPESEARTNPPVHHPGTIVPGQAIAADRCSPPDCTVPGVRVHRYPPVLCNRILLRFPNTSRVILIPGWMTLFPQSVPDISDLVVSYVMHF